MPSRRVGKLLTVIALTVLSASACTSDPPGPSPLYVDVQQHSAIFCAQEPAGHWDAPIGFTGGAYYNQSAKPLSIEAVSLIDPHGVILRSSLVYEQLHYKYPLPLDMQWSQFVHYSAPAQWAARQAIPGAVLPPGRPFKFSLHLTVYQIAVEIVPTSPRGGWTDGLLVKYKTNGTSYTARSYTGWAIAPKAATKDGPFCTWQENGIHAAWGR